MPRFAVIAGEPSAASTKKNMLPENGYLPGKNKKIGIIGVPLGYGAGKKGSELGPTALRLSTIRGGSLARVFMNCGLHRG